MPSSVKNSPSGKLELNNKLTKRATRSKHAKNANGTHLDFELDGEVVDIQSPDVFDSQYQPSSIDLHRSEILRRPLVIPASRRNPLRMDTQDGPWSISVAESPNDSTTYSIYIKTPTLHLTLTRAAAEISSLHSKLRDSYPILTLPPLPLDPSMLGVSGGKRKASFLNTLSRFASPGPKPRMPSSHVPSPQDIGEDPVLASPQSVTTSLASYLTALSNDQIVRVSKAWRRFVRVRTDDLESVRVERAIKRVRSDLAKHTTSPVTSQPPPLPSAPTVLKDAEPEVESMVFKASDQKDEMAESIIPKDVALADQALSTEVAANIPLPPEEKSLLEDENTAAAAAMATITPELTPASTPAFASKALEAPQAERDSVSQPTLTSSEDLLTKNQQAVHRLPRSASADPDKATRLSRLYHASALDSLTSTTDDESIAQSDEKRSNGVPRKSRRKVAIDDFDMLRVLGKGCAGKVLLVRHKKSEEMYALKAITKRHVLAHQELQHTLTEQAVLKRMAKDGADPFVVKLWWSFHDKENLFLVMDFHPGGDLATQLARWGRLGRDRARFYAAEIVEGVEGLHAAGVIYRDLKPENILIGVDGHIVLTDFGLSKEFPRQSIQSLMSPTAPVTPSGTKPEYYSAADVAAPTPYWMKGEDGSVSWTSPQTNDSTSTFCGTAEYLAPEVIQGLPYSYEVDWWSFGTMLYEMLSGITPFWANNHSDMYVRVLQDELQFPEDRSMDQDTRSLIRGLLQRNPALRIKEPRIKRHPYFSMIDWGHVYYKRYIPPYIPPVEAGNPSDTQNFDDAFLEMDPTLDNPDEQEPESQTTDSERERTDEDKTDGEDSVQTPAQSRSPSVHPVEEESVDVFDGYSFKGRQSVLIDDDELEGLLRAAEQDRDGEGEEEEDEIPAAILTEPVSGLAEEEPGEEGEEEESIGAKTPEAKPAPLPQVSEADEHEHEQEQEQEEEALHNERSLEPQLSEEPEDAVETNNRLTETVLNQSPRPSSDVGPREDGDAKADADGEPSVDDGSPSTTHREDTPTIKLQRRSKERSALPALESPSQLPEQKTQSSAANEEDDEIDDWDLVEAPGAEHQNGTRAPTLFARGVVDRYRLAVFRKTSSTRPKRPRRYFSGNSTDAETELNSAASPTPSEKDRRGRNPGLSLRAPKQFLRAKSPPSFSPQNSATSRSNLSKSSATMSGTINSLGGNTSSFSLKSKPSTSTVSVAAASGTPSDHSEPQSPPGSNTPGGATALSPRSTRPSFIGEEHSESKIKKMKKNYKEGAEKVLSLFGSPRS